MIRLTEIRLPLEHPEPALRAAVLARLGIADAALRALTVFKRGYDARKRAAIVFVYTLDCEVDDEAAVLARHAGDPHVRPAPDTRYRFVAPGAGRLRRRRGAAAGGHRLRPVRPLRRAAAGADGPAPDRPRARPGGARAHPRHLGPVAARRARSRVERAVRRGRRRHLLRRQALEPDQRPAPPRRARCSSEFVKAGAPEEILWVAKPHIGTFRLVGVVEKMRAEIERSAARSASAARRRPADRGRPGARPDDRARRRRTRPRGAARRPGGARPRPQRPRHLRDAARARRRHARPSRSRSAFASSIRRR